MGQTFGYVLQVQLNCKHLDKCLSTSTSISAFIDVILEAVLLQALQKCLRYEITNYVHENENYID